MMASCLYVSRVFLPVNIFQPDGEISRSLITLSANFCGGNDTNAT